MPPDLPDTFLLKAILADRVPKLIPDPDLLDFLADDVLRGEVFSAGFTPDGLHSLLGEHLLDFGACATDLEVQLVAEDLFEDIFSPKDRQIQVGDYLRAGKPLQEALKANAQSEEEDALPSGSCEMCERTMPLTVHHLYPREVQKKLLKRGLITDADKLAKAQICRQCHNTIHRLFENEQLAIEFNSIEKLLQDARIQKWVMYARKQKSRAVPGMRVAR